MMNSMLRQSIKDNPSFHLFPLYLSVVCIDEKSSSVVRLKKSQGRYVWSYFTEREFTSPLLLLLHIASMYHTRSVKGWQNRSHYNFIKREKILLPQKNVPMHGCNRIAANRGRYSQVSPASRSSAMPCCRFAVNIWQSCSFDLWSCFGGQQHPY